MVHSELEGDSRRLRCARVLKHLHALESASKLMVDPSAALEIAWSREDFEVGMEIIIRLSETPA